MKVIAFNKQSSFEYFIEERYEAGISLDGGEVKSIRSGKCSINDAYCSIYNGEIFLKNANIKVYDKIGTFNNADSTRDRRLLLHKREIVKLIGKVNQKGYTIVPIKMYFKQSLIKLEIALCKGKHTYDKKQTIKERDINRSAEREIKNYI